MLGLVLILLAAGSGPPLTYSRPDRDEGVVAPDAYDFTRWEAGAELFILPDEGNLREAPQQDSAVLATLPLGTPVRVLASAGERVAVQERVDRWYRVEATSSGGPPARGFVFGGILTPYRFEADFDADGSLDVATVGFTTAFGIRTRFRSSRPDAAVSWIDAGPAGEGFLQQRGGSFQAFLVEASEAGLPLVRIETRIEACGDLADHYVSLTRSADDPAQSLAQVALSLIGLVDPPSHSTFAVVFDPSARTARILRKTGDEESEELTEEVVTLVNGVFRPAPLP